MLKKIKKIAKIYRTNMIFFGNVFKINILLIIFKSKIMFKNLDIKNIFF